MTNTELCKYILHYVKEDRTRSAIMLTGEWGTGKSHYIKNELIPFLDKFHGCKCVLLSLYGLTSIGDISKSIYLEARAKKVLNSKSEGVAAGTLAVTTVIKGVSSFLGVELGGSEEELQKLYQSVDLSGKLVILEDIERTQVDLLELMGYVNNLVEQDGVKVLLVANEDEIIQYEPDPVESNDKDATDISEAKPKKTSREYTAQTLEYLKTKEKTISDTITYYGDYDGAIKQIIKSFEDKKLDYFSDNDRIKEIYRIMETHQNYNLRSFIYACQKTVDIYQSLEKSYNADFMTCIFYGIIHFSLRAKTGERMAWTGTDVFSVELGCEKYPLFKFCYDYIQRHTLNRDRIPVSEKTLESFRLYDRRKTQNDPDLIVVAEYYRYPETKLRAAVKSVQIRLNDPKDISFYDYGSLAVNLLSIKHCYGIDVSTGKRLLVENLRGRGGEIDQRVLFRITLLRENTPLQREYDALKEAMIEALGGNKFLQQFSYSPDETDTFVQRFGDNEDYYESGKLAALLDIPRMIEMFLACTPDQMNNIRFVFLKIYRPSNIGQYLSADLDALNKLRDGVMEGMKTHQLDCVQKLQCEWFVGNLLDAIEKLR